MESQALEAEARIRASQLREEALENAIQAAELYIKAVKLAHSQAERQRLQEKCMKLLAKAEEIKKAATWPPETPRQLESPSCSRKLGLDEERLLLESSRLNGFIFPPWKSDPAVEQFEGTSLYTEDIDLTISPSQLAEFAGWKRPAEALRIPRAELASVAEDQKPTMDPIHDVDLVQDVTTDCSVVASLCAGVARAKQGHVKLLHSIMFPYDKVNDRPEISKTGKYVYRLHFNGCFRQVVIDDRLPASKSSRTLHVVDRQNPMLLWPALLEKAYLKVRGGYDFPGSNSGTDLWVLTGWIPEQIFLQSDDVIVERLWKRIHTSYSFGDVMITLGTGQLSPREEHELALAGQHDYAVLGMAERDNQKWLLVKNPWCEGTVWKGETSTDSQTGLSAPEWTTTLRDALPSTAPVRKFWMTFDHVLQYFESLYLNWNPGLFKYRQDHHFSMSIPPFYAPGAFASNPQFTLQSVSGGTIWLLLSRHFQTAEHKTTASVSHSTSGSSSRVTNEIGFISLYLFDNNGSRVYLSDGAMYRGPFVDSPQTLARVELSPNKSITVVAAQQHLPLPKYFFTLSTFSLHPVSVQTAPDIYPHTQTLLGQWTSKTSGGNAGTPTYCANPQYSLTIPSSPSSSPSSLQILLETDAEQLAIHIAVVWSSGKRATSVTTRDILASSGSYRRSCCLASLPSLSPSVYTLILSTFTPGQAAKFRLRVTSSVAVTIKPFPAESAGRLETKLTNAVFPPGTDRLLAPISLSRITRFCATANHLHRREREAGRGSPLKISLELGQGPNKKVLDVSGEDEFSDVLAGVRTSDVDLRPEMMRKQSGAVEGGTGGIWLVVERLPGTGVAECVEVCVLSDVRVDVGVWGTGDG